MDFNNSDFLRLLAPLSRFAIIIGAWLVSEWIYKNSRFAGVNVLGNNARCLSNCGVILRKPGVVV